MDYDIKIEDVEKKKTEKDKGGQKLNDFVLHLS